VWTARLRIGFGRARPSPRNGWSDLVGVPKIPLWNARTKNHLQTMAVSDSVARAAERGKLVSENT
jgi:hypothetical protein